jgi:hypothetical protein
MKQKFILTSIALVVVAASLFFYFRQRQLASPTAAIPELLLLSPADADSIVYVDFTALRRSPFFAQLLALAPSAPEDPEYREFVTATGFDYSRDLDRALIATRPSAAPAWTMAIADGRFDRAKIAAFALRAGKLEKRNGDEVYLVSSEKPARTISFTFLAPGRILLANSAVLDVTALRPAHDPLPAQRDRFLRVAGAALIVLARIDASQENFTVFGFRSRDLKRALQDVRWVSLGARPDGDSLKVALEAECISTDAARELTAAAETLRLLARVLLADTRTRRQMSPQAAALVGAILRNGEFIQIEQRVQMRFEISADSFGSPASSDAGRSTPEKVR